LFKLRADGDGFLTKSHNIYICSLVLEVRDPVIIGKVLNNLRYTKHHLIFCPEMKAKHNFSCTESHLPSSPNAFSAPWALSTPLAVKLSKKWSRVNMDARKRVQAEVPGKHNTLPS
jgi:hypothetical protein